MCYLVRLLCVLVIFISLANGQDQDSVDSGSVDVPDDSDSQPITLDYIYTQGKNSWN